MEQWVDASIQVYEKGWLMRHDPAQGWQERRTGPDPGYLGEEGLWLYDPAWGGWFTKSWLATSFRQDARPFVPFFAMLERHAPAPLK